MPTRLSAFIIEIAGSLKVYDVYGNVAMAISIQHTTTEILDRFIEGRDTPDREIVLEIELTGFNERERNLLLPHLWQFILQYRDSNDPDTLLAVAAAIRKYIAIMPMERMGELAVLLESGHKAQIPIELEIEVAKMIGRNFEVHPPVESDPFPELAERLWDMVRAYIHPRVLLRDKYAAATSVGVEALVSMRSQHADDALHAVADSPYRWFAEIVSDNLDRLAETWSAKNPDAAAWLKDLRSGVASHT